jgi:hypothetical protein
MLQSSPNGGSVCRMTITRRELLQLAGASAIADVFVDEVSRRAARVISDYSAEGFHRTATRVDRASADRLVRAVREAGATARLEAFELSRVDPGPAFLEIDGRQLEGLPMFDAPFTTADGVRGPIGAITSDAPIGWTRIAPNGDAQLRRVRDAAPHRAIVAVTTGPHPGLCPVNAQYFAAPFGPPVLQVGSEHAEAIERAAGKGSAVRVVAHATRRPATAFNVVVDVEGTRADLAPFAVMTPRSGWHYNASERGGGLVCWLETIRAVASARPLRTARFVASSGHELGHLGLQAYLHQRTSLAHDALVWLHFGANIGAVGGPVTTTCSDKEWEAMAIRAFAESGVLRLNSAPADRVGGEAATIREQGGRFISFIGSNTWFHHPRDRWPDTVNIGTVVRFATASAALAVTLANRS